MNNILQLIGRDREIFDRDISGQEQQLADIVGKDRFLVIGGAGSIGQAVVKEIFMRQPRVLHVVDISENNMVELVRDIRSSFGYIKGDFRTFAIDCGSVEFDALVKSGGPYDYVLNLSALKHVRSEKDPFTLMRMVDVNVLNTNKTIEYAVRSGSKKYFCVSTDKATNPVNMMGASKRIMEMFLMRYSLQMPVATARFANVAFSDGSLLHGFNQRIMKSQPLSAPRDVRRYFLTPKESGELCLMSCLLGENRDIFFPKLDADLHLITFADIAVRYLEGLGYEPYLCGTEDEARAKVQELKAKRQWPCYFFDSDTTGEKEYEEFYTSRERLDLEKFQNIGVIKNDAVFAANLLDKFVTDISAMKLRGAWEKDELVRLFNAMIPEFNHKEIGKSLDQRM